MKKIASSNKSGLTSSAATLCGNQCSWYGHFRRISTVQRYLGSVEIALRRWKVPGCAAEPFQKQRRGEGQIWQHLASWQNLAAELNLVSHRARWELSRSWLAGAQSAVHHPQRAGNGYHPALVLEIADLRSLFRLACWPLLVGRRM